MTTLYEQYKDFIKPRSPGLAPPHAVRKCQNPDCGVEQPGSSHVNDLCYKCQSVCLWDTKGEL